MSNLSSSKLFADYQNAYASLNARQKQAVDKIYGPVMVVAGPGTGKTQLLAVRVCRILELTDVNPDNILCLTYTDAGCTAMRKRLVKFMGSTAYQVNIFTFHSFCNTIIRENPDKFTSYRELTNASDLEILEIITEIIDELPLDHPNKKLAGEIYYHRPKWRNLFNVLKLEGWSPEFVKTKIEDYRKEAEEDPQNISKSGKTKGKLRADVIKKLREYDFAYFGAPLLAEYDRKLRERGLIDFNDSINWVLKVLKEDENLLLMYQEKYQFILADEYQDTNGSQNDLLFTLAQNEYIEEPNLFVVGDDDQSIFRFQGASTDNILKYYETFKPQIIVLEDNYRSAQSILDIAGKVITENKERLLSTLPQLTKNLTEQRKTSGQNFGPEVIRYKNVMHQACGVVQKIEQLHREGVPYHEMAIIYRSHKESIDLLKYFTFAGVPISIKKRVNILSLPEINRLLTLLKYLEGEYQELNSQNDKLFQILHYNFWGLDARDIGKLALIASRNTDDGKDDILWRDLFGCNEIMKQNGVSDSAGIKRVMDILESLINDYPNVTPQVFFEKVITETGLLNHILGNADQLMRLQSINTLFDFVKEETHKTENITVREILATIQKLEEMGIDLSINFLQTNDQGINFMTAHGAKGLEFEHVFMINVNKNSWGKTKSGTYDVKLPPNMFFSAGEASIEDERRLFYVGLTRAKNHLYISYSEMNEDGSKEVEPAQFITELGIDEQDIKEIKFEDEVIANFTSIILRYQQGKLQMIDHDLIDRILLTMHMNATGISKYLECPRKFYFENILRIPKARNANLGFGNVIHFALETYYKKVYAQNEPCWLPYEELESALNRGFKKFHSHFSAEEYKNLEYYGKNIMQKHYQEVISNQVIAEDSRVEYKIKTHIDEIPVSGILDRIDFYRDHVRLYDYKTGNRDGSNEKFKPGIDLQTGGDYWRQGVFYKLLLDHEGKNSLPLRKITFEFLERESKSQVEVEASLQEIELVKGQLEYVYTKIKNHEFEEGCNDEKCIWCNFVNNNMQLSSSVDYLEELSADIDD